ncbi:hypothetical protein I316_02777 [Kwoniella heveanensis BCC8398]|uniref:MAGE domain-containing protein n=1 Tax=Kwoniella heveanensis BCC8398 TaxID=1296120 RepID=A0A1B9GXG9_9TREE|nr:hypothetical protein I316_02777 [Kwoniella heveanensis BCC8398]
MPPKRPSTTYGSQGPSQRRRRRASPSDDEEDSDDGSDSAYEDGRVGRSANARSNANASQIMDEGEFEEEEDRPPAAGGKGMTEPELRRKAGQLVRFALFQEYKKNLIRRTDITKHVIPNHTRSFNVVFARAQRILRDTMGCELYEVRAKDKGNVSATQVNGEATEPRAGQTQAQRNKGKGRARAAGDDDAEEDEEDGGADGDEGVPSTHRARATGTKAYILRSILPPDLLAAMSYPAPLPVGAEAQEEEGEDSGALIQWEKGDGTSSGHIALLGIRTIILAVIMTLGRVASDDQLHAYLRRLNLDRDTILPYASADSKEPRLTLDKYLDLLAKQSYLEKVKLPAPGHNPEAESCEWRWGQRDAEFSEKDAATFIERMMLGAEEDESSDEEEEDNEPRRRRRQRNRAEKAARRNKLRDDIVKAVGGPLNDVA